MTTPRVKNSTQINSETVAEALATMYTYTGLLLLAVQILVLGVIGGFIGLDLPALFETAYLIAPGF